PRGLFEVSATGGAPKPLLTQEAFRGLPTTEAVSEGWFIQGVQFLPVSRRRVIVFEFGGNLLMRDLDSGHSELLGPGRFPAYSPSGHLVFQSNSWPQEVRAQPFSLSTLKTTAGAFVIVRGGSEPSVANDGTLSYVDPQSGRLVWLNRQGQQL